MNKAMLKFILTAVVFTFIFSCNNQKQKSDKEYISAINKWHRERVKSLKEEDSWLSLSGLYLLKEGTQSIGADSSHDIIFPAKAPVDLGTITLQDSIFTFKTHRDAMVTHNGSPVKQLKLQSDSRVEPTILKHGSFLWYIIKRRNNFYIRLKDTKHPSFSSFDGIERFPVLPKWKIKTEFKPFSEPKLISIPDILGDVYQDTLYGTLEFFIDDKKYDLAPLGNPEKDEEFFIIFGDETNGETTYGGGRYLYLSTPNENNVTYIDFNKAYNPPCVFNRFATCPLPPVQNRLPIKITAGEKMYEAE